MEFSIAKLGIFVLWFVLSILVGIVASIKNRLGLAFFVLSVLLSPMVGMAVLLYINRNVAK